MQPAAAADAAERRALGQQFVELCRIESPSGRERACAEYVRAELRALGLDVHEDDAGPVADSECGNLLARIAARRDTGAWRASADCTASAETAASGAPCLLLCAHLDTVPLHAPVEPVLVDGGYENANAAILGADNKAAVAVLLALARRLCAHGSPIDVELLFTVGEERSLAGARALDTSRLRSDYGYVFDHASPIGEIVLASPSHYRIDASFHGRAAHAGLRPQDGRSAIVACARAISDMPLGRIDEQTTANVGTIAGGSALNVVAERCALAAEVRSLSDAAAEAALAEMIDCVHEAANLPECDCDVDVAVQKTFAGYTTPTSAPAVRVAEAALRSRGFQPRHITSGGASDANALIARGFTVVNLANGTERNHEPSERVSIAALEGMLDVALALPAAVEAEPAATARALPAAR